MSPEQVQAVLDRADCLFDRTQIDLTLERLAGELHRDLASANPLVLVVLKGGMIPAGLLLPRLNFALEVDYIHASRYRGGLSGSELHWLAQPKTDLAGRHVLLVDDILDEGYTLQALQHWCQQCAAASVRTLVLTEKQHQRKAPGVAADYVGLQVPDRYVFGCGMDYHEYLRNAPGIYAVADPDLN